MTRSALAPQRRLPILGVAALLVLLVQATGCSSTHEKVQVDAEAPFLREDTTTAQARRPRGAAERRAHDLADDASPSTPPRFGASNRARPRLVIAGGATPYARHPETADPHELGPAVSIPSIAALRSVARSDQALPVPSRVAVAFAVDGRLRRADDRAIRLGASLEDGDDLVAGLVALPLPEASPTGRPLELADLARFTRERGFDVLLIQATRPTPDGLFVEGLSIVVATADAVVVSVVSQRGPTGPGGEAPPVPPDIAALIRDVITRE